MTQRRPFIDRSACPGQDGCHSPGRIGTPTAYKRWGCRCPDAYAATITENKRRTAGLLTPALVPALATTRRLQALACLGYSAAAIAAETGGIISRAQVGHLRNGHRYRHTTAEVEAAVAAAFNRLWLTPAPPGRHTTAVRNQARREGWAPAAAWDDDTITDPRATPQHLAVGTDEGEGEEYEAWLLDSLVSDSAFQVPVAMAGSSGRPRHPFIARAARELMGRGRDIQTAAWQLRTSDRSVQRVCSGIEVSV